MFRLTTMATLKRYPSATANHRYGFPRSARLASASTAQGNPFKTWNKPMIECHGDYREEAFLEEHIGGPLYEHQKSLPRLPIPSLQETMKRFLPTALPLAKSEEERTSLKEACRIFPEQAQLLQERLEERRNVEMYDSSWLQLWWNTAGYLQVRDPIVINVSYFFHFSDDSTLPLDRPFNVTRGAAIMSSVAEFRKQICSGSFPAEQIGRKTMTPLCSVAFKYMFNAARVPKRHQDSYRIYDPSLLSHCIVARKGHFFAVDFVDPQTGDPLPLATLELSLQECIAKADAGSALELGWLTSNQRDACADARDALLQAGAGDAIVSLESGAFLLCLDDEEPVSRKQCGELFLHGGETSGMNRWFDKSIQFFCTNNGKAGYLGEHSMMDGMPCVALANHVTSQTYETVSAKSSQATTATTVENIFERITPQLVHSNIPEFIQNAKAHFMKLTGDHDLHVQSFQGYGSNFMKKCGFSPDAYVQIAMQLATYRLWGEQAGTYEATQVRPFLHGRTETTRTISIANEAFVKKMGLFPNFIERDKLAREEKVNLLRAAVDSHIEYIGNAAKAMGVDRHFLGLSMLVKDGEVAPDLYSHPLFIRSKRWRVSTSNLTHPNFENWGYGEVFPDGVGLAYSVKSDSCCFNVTALKDLQWTDRLCHHLEEALLEMQTLVEVDQHIQSRL